MITGLGLAITSLDFDKYPSTSFVISCDGINPISAFDGSNRCLKIYQN